MIPKEFDSIAKDDISALVSDAAPEGRTIEYKQQLPTPNDEDTREFLADASSFANASGGDLVYGIREKRDSNNKATGIPETVEGLAAINADAEIRRLDQMLRSSIDPRMPGFRIKSIGGFPSGPVLVIRIPKSWASPHMVTFKNLSRFYARTSAGKYQLSVGEIRAAFETSTTLTARIETFRIERLAKIAAGETPLPMGQARRCVVHLYPISAADSIAGKDVTVRASVLPDIQCFYNSPTHRRFNFDGLIAFPALGSGEAFAYVQIFRNGIIEGVFNCALADLCRMGLDAEERKEKEGKVLSAGHLEGHARIGIGHFLKLLRQLELDPPIVVLMSLTGVKGMELSVDSPFSDFREATPFDRDVLALPESIIDSYEIPLDKIVRPIFDIAWQACGSPRSKNYNAQGRWDGGASAMALT